MDFSLIKTFVYRVGGIKHNLSTTLQRPGGPPNLLCRTNDALIHSALALGSGGSIADGDGGGEDGLNDGS